MDVLGEQIFVLYCISHATHSIIFDFENICKQGDDNGSWLMPHGSAMVGSSPGPRTTYIYIKTVKSKETNAFPSEVV